MNRPDPSNRLRQIREDCEFSRRDLATEIEVTEETIRRFEENRGGPIPSKYIPTLAAFLKVTPEYLMGWDGGAADQLVLDNAKTA